MLDPFQPLELASKRCNPATASELEHMPLSQIKQPSDRRLLFKNETLSIVVGPSLVPEESNFHTQAHVPARAPFAITIPDKFYALSCSSCRLSHPGKEEKVHTNRTNKQKLIADLLMRKKQLLKVTRRQTERDARL